MNYLAKLLGWQERHEKTTHELTALRFLRQVYQNEEDLAELHRQITLTEHSLEQCAEMILALQSAAAPQARRERIWRDVWELTHHKNVTPVTFSTVLLSGNLRSNTD